MKILMIGLGSIGQRHLRNIKKYYKNVEFIAYRKRGLSLTLSDDLKIREGINLEEEYNIAVFNKLDDALSQKPDIAFITNITSEHINSAIMAADAGCDIFIEKPLSFNLESVDKLIEVVESKKIVAFMGFQMRYHPGLLKLKQIIFDSKIGNILSINVAVGDRLTTIHTYEDYRTLYMARNDYGGGVILSILIHELDYLRWLFGIPVSVYSVGGKLSNLDIDVEDVSETIFILEKNGKKIPIRVHADMMQYPSSRFCKIICDNGNVHVDLINNTIEWTIGDDINTQTFADFNKNDMFIAEIKDFFTAVENRSMPKITIDDGVASLKLALAIKKSMESNSIISLTHI